MKLIDLLSGPIADALGWTLLHTIWQGFGIVLPTAVVLHLLRGRSSNARYQVGVLTLLIQLLTSVATFAWYYEPAVRAFNTGNNRMVAQSLPVRWQVMTQTLPWPQQVQQFLQIHLGEFVLVYLIGVALFGLRLAGGWVYLQRLSRAAAKPASPKWAELTNTLRSALAIPAVVRVRESARIAVPMVVGVLKPVLLLPIGLAANLSIREIEAVLAHELAHVKRHDYTVNLLQSVMEVLYFFHPALWWLSARVREEREHCCDDLAVQAIGGDARILARALAHVEELRLTQTDQPALAMALTTKRQQLLHRVRRILGVPTRPFISNSSLAGLTLATVLLVSVSVYAVQKQNEPQPKPKSRPTQLQSTRRHTIDTSSEYGMVNDNKISHVIWKGQKLSASRVTGLQRQLDQVMAGRLNLNEVKQPNRDILLTIIETNNTFDEGMNGLAEGLAHLDYKTIIKTGMDAANAAGTFPVDVDNVLKEVHKIDYDRVIGDAMASIDTNITFFNDGDVVKFGNDAMTVRNRARQADSLGRIIAQRSQQMQVLQLQMEKLRFPVEEAERNREVLEWRKEKLMDQRNALIEKHQRLLRNDGKQKLSQTDVEKQLEAIQPEIKKQEGGIEEMNQKLEAMQLQVETARQPLEKLEREVEQLNDQMSALSDQMDRHGAHLNRELNINLNKDLNRDLNEQRRHTDRQLRELEFNMKRLESEPDRAVDRVRPGRAPRPPRTPNAVRPTLPHAPPTPPAPVLAPVPRPEPVIAPVPKVAPAPRPPKP